MDIFLPLDYCNLVWKVTLVKIEAERGRTKDKNEKGKRDNFIRSWLRSHFQKARKSRGRTKNENENERGTAKNKNEKVKGKSTKILISVESQG